MSLKELEERGKDLAKKASEMGSEPDIVLCCSVKGFNVAKAVSEQLDAELDLRFCDSIQVPGETDVILAGVAEDGTAWIDKDVKEEFMVSGAFIDRARIVKGRTLGLRKMEFSDKEKEVSGKKVLIVDSSIEDSNRIAAVTGSVLKEGVSEIDVAALKISEASIRHLEELCERVIFLDEGLDPDLAHVSEDSVVESIERYEF